MIFDELIIAVSHSPKKKPLFSLEERLSLVEASVREYRGVRVEAFNGLLVDYVEEKGGIAIIRGLRAVSDFEYEMQMALMSRRSGNRFFDALARVLLPCIDDCKRGCVVRRRG